MEPRGGNGVEYGMRSLTLAALVAAVPAQAAAPRSFALDLLRKLPAKGNLFFSPYSAAVALALAGAGAEGETKAAFERVLAGAET
ncbi:MAG: hypothetical protein KGL53_02180, partial [Elusimicrobia bacterium]|nr:hypothetical protein [Elusimicrobiota bacterium]